MSRLRRLLVTGRIFFITTHFDQASLPVRPADRDEVLRALAATRECRGLWLFAYCVMPTHFHLMFGPRGDDSMSSIMREMKLQAAKRILRARNTPGRFWQPRSFVRIIRHRKEWGKTMDYIHWNPVKDGCAEKPEDWLWSSWFGWNPGGTPPVPVDFVDLPIDEKAPIGW